MRHLCQGIERTLQVASKTVPRGSVHQLRLWHQQHFYDLLGARNKAWQIAINNDSLCERKAFEAEATAVREALSQVKTSLWREVALTLSYSTDPQQVARVLDTLGGK